MSLERLSIDGFDPMRTKADDLAVKEGYFWSKDEAARVQGYIENLCKLSVGEWEAQPLLLMPYQQDFIWRCYGWLDKSTGLRRFREAFLMVAKKNGKSPLISALGLYHLTGDGENAPEVYINAAAREQATIVYREASRMVKQEPELDSILTEVESMKRIKYPARNGFLVANSADVGSKDGVQSSFTIFDELHRQPDRKLWDVFQHAGIARRQRLKVSITTAGDPDPDHVCYQQYNRALAIEDGANKDLRFLGCLYGPRPDVKESVDDRKVWRMANPAMGVTFSERDFAEDLEAAKLTPADLITFKRLRLNFWLKEIAKFIDPEIWHAQPDRRTDDEIDASGDFWTAGLDMSHSRDLTAYVRTAGNLVKGLDVFTKVWIPEETAVKRSREEGLPYLEYAERGWVELIPGPVIDPNVIEAFILADHAEHPLKSVYSDFVNTAHMGANLLAKKVPFKFIVQGSMSMHPPTKALETLILERKLRHGGDAMLTYCALNAVVDKNNKNENMMLIKSKSTGRIDAAVALVEAIAGVLDQCGYGEPKPSVKRSIVWL
jgi:phage terminase large subunit-like protein